MKLKIKYNKVDPEFPNLGSVTISYGKGKKKSYMTTYLQPGEKRNGYDLADQFTTFLGGALWKAMH